MLVVTVFVAAVYVDEATLKLAVFVAAAATALPDPPVSTVVITHGLAAELALKLKGDVVHAEATVELEYPRAGVTRTCMLKTP